jgi:hypothetical protein
MELSSTNAPPVMPAPPVPPAADMLGLRPENMNLQQIGNGLVKFGRQFVRAHVGLTLLTAVQNEHAAAPIVRLAAPAPVEYLEFNVNAMLREWNAPNRKAKLHELFGLYADQSLRELLLALQMLQTFCAAAQLQFSLQPESWQSPNQESMLNELANLLPQFEAMWQDFVRRAETDPEVDGLGRLADVLHALGQSGSLYERIQDRRLANLTEELRPCLLKLCSLVTALRATPGLNS